MVRMEVSGKVIRLLMSLNDCGVTVEELYHWIVAGVEREFEHAEQDKFDRLDAICKALYEFGMDNI